MIGAGSFDMEGYKSKMMSAVLERDQKQQEHVERSLQDSSNVTCVRVVDILEGEGTDGCFVEMHSLDSEIFLQGSDSPCMYASGIPVAVVPSGSAQSGQVNQLATYFMVDVKSGVAPMEWQSGVGDVLLVRRDRKPLHVHQVFALWDYFNVLMDRYKDGENDVLAVNEDVFAEWLQEYNDGQNEMARNGYGGSQLRITF